MLTEIYKASTKNTNLINKSQEFEQIKIIPYDFNDKEIATKVDADGTPSREYNDLEGM